MIVSILILAVSLVASYQLVAKMGMEGWRGLIPFYNTYVIGCGATKNRKLVVANVALQVALVVFSVVASFVLFGALFGTIGMTYATSVNGVSVDADVAASAGVGLGIVVILIYIVAFALGIASLVFDIMLMIRLARSFGQSSGFVVGLVLLTVIFMAILAFGDAQYLGPCED